MGMVARDIDQVAHGIFLFGRTIAVSWLVEIHRCLGPLCRTVPWDLCEGDKLVMAIFGSKCPQPRQPRRCPILGPAEHDAAPWPGLPQGRRAEPHAAQATWTVRFIRGMLERGCKIWPPGKWNYEGGDWNLILSSCSLRAKVENGILSKEGDPTAQLTQRKHWDALAILGSDRWASALSRTELSFWEFAAIGNGT